MAQAFTLRAFSAKNPSFDTPSESVGYFQSSAARTQSHLPAFNDLLPKFLAAEQADEGPRCVFKSFHDGLRVFHFSFREPLGQLRNAFGKPRSVISNDEPFHQRPVDQQIRLRAWANILLVEI